MEAFAFEIIQRPDGKFTLRHYTKGAAAVDYGPFKDKEVAEKGMTHIITPTVYRYNAIGTLLKK